MDTWRYLPFALLALLAAPAAQAHEFWMLPESFRMAPGAAGAVSLASGEDFRGDQVAFSATMVASLRHHSADQVTDLRSRIPSTAQVIRLPVVFRRPGTHVIAFDSRPSNIVLPPEKFNAYLREEGLDFIARKRVASGTSGLAGREHFHRNTKTLVQVGDRLDKTYALRTGQRLEIVPLANPAAKRAGDSLAFQVFFDNKPLANALVRAWNRQGTPAQVSKVTTDIRGQATVSLSRPGAWMISVVHMVAAERSANHDWDSYWGNLTFALHDGGDLAALTVLPPGR